MSQLREVLREASANVVAAVVELQENLGTPEPLACALLQEDEMQTHLGGSEHAVQTHERFFREMQVAGKMAMMALSDALKRATGALRQTME